MPANIKYHSPDRPFVTESGFAFKKPVIAYKTWGNLNDTRDNAVLICHALTGNAEADDWFGDFFSDGGIFDPANQFIICMNILGSCYGSTGPWSVNPDTGEPYRTDFPDITVRDIVNFQRLLLDDLDISAVEFVIGGSLGGMQALEFALIDDRVRAAVPIAVGKAHTSWQIGISHTQRQAIYADPDWNGGNYQRGQGPGRGLAIARMMAMISYRCQNDYEIKFGRDLQPGRNDLFQVESYLNYQGEKLVKRFDALSYVALTKAMDSHDVSRNRNSFAEALGSLDIPVLVLGINSDILYPVSEQKELVNLLGNGKYAEIDSKHGHDAFLIEFEKMGRHIHRFLKENGKRRFPTG